MLMRKINISLGIILVAVLMVKQFILFEISAAMDHAQGGDNSSGAASAQKLTGDVVSDSVALAISQGVPAVYGFELNVSFSAVQNAINIMQKFDPGYGAQKIALSADELKRYTDIGLRISCEYCCGAKSIVFQDGSPACGCAHSQAMRGLAAYLIKNHGSEYSDDMVLRELARWKGVFFPKQMINKMAVALKSGNYAPDTAALALGAELPVYGKDGKSVPLPSDITSLPSMVGGC